MTTKHTPGPWYMEESCNDYAGKLIMSDNRTVAETVIRDSVKATKEEESNARLIAAAPELLEALKAIRPYLSAGEALIADAAIAKAEGK